MALNILLVDDSRTVRDVIAKTLSLARLPLGQLYHAANGREALDLLGDCWIDLVFADINMPVMTGVEMIEKMSEDGLLKSVPVIIVSTEGCLTRVEMLKSKGVRAYIRKPFTPELIRNVVEDVLGVVGPDSEALLLGKVFCEVLERYAFLFAEPLPRERVPEAPGNQKRGSLSFRGAARGSLALAFPWEACAEMAMNILGGDPVEGVTEEQGSDAFRELVSVTCGHVLTALKGDRLQFDLSPPVVQTLEAPGWRSMAEEPQTLAFTMEHGPVLLSFKEEPSS